MPRSRVCLVSLPWDYYQSPSVAVGCLAAYARKRGVRVDARHLHLEAAALFGLRPYDMLAYQYPVIGEALAAMHLLPAGRDALLAFARETFEDAELCSERLAEVMRDIYRRYDWAHYELVGFTIHFAQLFSSILFARWLKEDYPHLRVVLGGGCVSDGMARSVLEQFPWIDWCHRGDGEEALVALARGVTGKVEGFERDVPGLAHRVGSTICLNPKTQLERLEGLPDPDYDHYFELRASHPALAGVTVPTYLPVEVSRGCLHKCTFCNFNAGVNYRPRPYPEVAASMRRMSRRYRVNAFCLMALMIPVAQTETFFKAISPRKSGYRIFCEGRANLTRRQLQVMREAGVTELQAGIEALNTSVLRKMKKGTRFIDNLQVMKLCEDLGLKMNSFLMLGFPTETQEEVNDSVDAVDFACAYAPLTQIAPFTLREGSPVDLDPGAYGVYDVSAAGLFSSFALGGEGTAPVGGETLGHVNGIDYWYKSFKNRNPACDYDLLKRRLSLWQRHYERARESGRPLLCYVDSRSFLTIEDRRHMVALAGVGGRSATGLTQYVLDGWEREAYLLCDSIHEFGTIAAAFPGIDPGQIRTGLDRLVGARVMYCEDDRYLALAIDGHPARRQGVPFPWI